LNYSDNPAHCRVEIFKPKGKWYTTIQVEFKDYTCPNIFRAFKDAIVGSEEGKRYWDDEMDWIFVCFDPYHEHAYPLMLQCSNYQVYGW